MSSWSPASLYHLTTPAGSRDISRVGYLDPARSLGKLPVVWLVAGYRIPWAASFVSYYHGVQIVDLWAFHVMTKDLALVRSNRRGVYACYQRVPVEDSCPVSLFLVQSEKYFGLLKNWRSDEQKPRK